MDRRVPFARIVQHMMPFFVSRQIFTGAGKVGAENNADPCDYQISQRADFQNKIGAPKSRAGTRTVPLPPSVVQELREWKMRCPKQRGKNDPEDGGRQVYVFPNEIGRAHV